MQNGGSVCALPSASLARHVTYRDKLAAEGPPGMTDKGMIPTIVRSHTG
jgi:hypothetical protein